MESSRRHRPFWILLAVALGTAAIYGFFNWLDTGKLWTPLDDAFIYAQYAREISRGDFYEYHPGEGVTTGVTSPLYPWCLVPAFWLGLGGERIVWWWFGLGVIWRVWMAVLVFRLAADWSRDRRVGWIAALFALFAGNYNWAVSSGMEAGMVSVLLLLSLRLGQTWVTVLAQPGSKLESRRRIGFGIALALLMLARPEGAATGLLAFVCLGVWLRRRGGAVVRAWAWLGLALLPWVLWMVFARVNTGYFSMSGTVKTLPGLPGYNPVEMLAVWFDGVRVTFTGDFMGMARFPGWGWVAVALGCAGLAWPRGKRGSVRGGLATIWLAGLLVPPLSLAPFVQNARYQSAHIPLLVVLGVYGVWRLGARIPRGRRMIWGGVGGLAAVVTLGGFVNMAQQFATQTEDMFYLHRRVARWIRENTEPSDRIALTDVGTIPFLTNRLTLDFVGLTNRSMVGMLAQGQGAVWHAVERLEPRMRPDWLVMFPEWFQAELLGPEEAAFHLDRVTVAVGKKMVIARFLPPLPWAEKRVPPEAQEVKPNSPLVQEGDDSSTGSLETARNRNTKRKDGTEERARGVSSPVARSADAESTPLLAWSELGLRLVALQEAPTTSVWRLVDAVDMADLPSERAHEYRYRDEAQWTYHHPGPLSVAQASPRDLWQVADGGRSWTEHEEFRLQGIRPDAPLRLALRTYSDNPHRVRVVVEGRAAGLLSIPENDRSGIFDIVVFDLAPEVLKGSTSPHIRFEMVRNGKLEEYPYHTSFFLWALQPAVGPENEERTGFERDLAGQFALEARRWAEAWREEHGETFPVDSEDPVLFQSGWSDPEEDLQGEPVRWGLGRESFMIVPSPGPFGDRVLEFTVRPYVPPGRGSLFWNWIAVKVNGTEVFRKDLLPEEQTFRCSLSGKLLYRGINDLRFMYGRTYVPAQFEPGNPEMRPFGARFSSIRFVTPKDPGGEKGTGSP
jgi:hypothetical protein